MLEGRYTDAYLSRGRRRRAEIHADGISTIIASPVDFVGLNVYSPGLYVLPSEGGAGLRRAVEIRPRIRAWPRRG